MRMGEDELKKRISRALELIGEVKQEKEGLWKVGERLVTYVNDDFTCNCPDHVYRGVYCKHILAVVLYEGGGSYEKRSS